MKRLEHPRRRSERSEAAKAVISVQSVVRYMFKLVLSWYGSTVSSPLDTVLSSSPTPS